METDNQQTYRIFLYYSILTIICVPLAGIRFGCPDGAGPHRMPGRILLRACDRRKRKSSESAEKADAAKGSRGGAFRWQIFAFGCSGRKQRYVIVRISGT